MYVVSLHNKYNARARATHTRCPFGFVFVIEENKSRIVYMVAEKDAVLSCITHTKHAQTHRHLVYLIVECLTHHHTWISSSPFTALSLSLPLSLANTHAHTETTNNQSEESEGKTKASTICLAI